MFIASKSEHHQPPSALVSGRFLGLFAMQLIAVALGLAISSELYSTFREVNGRHEDLTSNRQQIDRLSDRLEQLFRAIQVRPADQMQRMAISVELNEVTESAQKLLDTLNGFPEERSGIGQKVAELEVARRAWQLDGQGQKRGAAEIGTAVTHMEWALASLRSGVDSQDEENFGHIDEIRRIIFWNNICEGFACLLMVFSFLWTVRLYRRLRREELARFHIESELAAERQALERRVQARTAALNAEVMERQRAESLNRGRNHVLELVARNKPIAEILQVLADTLAEYRTTWACVVHTLDSGLLKLTASSGLSDRVNQHLRSIATDFGGAPESVALASGKPCLIEDLGEEHRTWSELLRANGLLSVWSAPYFAPSGGALGTITIYTFLKWNPTATDIEMLETARNMAALVLERSRMQEQLVEHAYHDSLTGLPNRRLGRDRLLTAISRAERACRQMAVLWIDLDKFKRINDQYGHPMGDAILQKAAQRLTGRLRASDTLARMGGDEFMAVLDEIDGREEAEKIACDLLKILARPMKIGELEFSLTASIGISLYPSDGRTVDSLAQHADQAMYAAKFGCCGTLSFSPEMDREPAQRRELEAELAQALENEGFTLAYQPMCLPDGSLKGFEALLRFESPRLGNVPPSQFIPITEETQLIVPLGEWVLREVCRQIREWQSAGLPPVSIAVNISALQFDHDDFADTVAEILRETGVAGANLVLELTESIVMSDFSKTAQQMKRLKRLGVRIAIDDFGTGYSSLSYLHRLPIDELKIDRSFIENLHEQEGTRPIVEAVLSMANMLGLRVVAEGVETAEQLNTLAQCGCDIIQGYFFSRPVGQDSAAIFLQSGRLEGGQTTIPATRLGEPVSLPVIALAG